MYYYSRPLSIFGGTRKSFSLYKGGWGEQKKKKSTAIDIRFGLTGVAYAICSQIARTCNVKTGERPLGNMTRTGGKRENLENPGVFIRV